MSKPDSRPNLRGGFEAPHSLRTLRFQPKAVHPHVFLSDARQNYMIDSLLADQIGAPMPKSPTDKPLRMFARYCLWCKSIGRSDVFNRRLARKFLRKAVFRISNDPKSPVPAGATILDFGSLPQRKDVADGQLRHVALELGERFLSVK